MKKSFNSTLALLGVFAVLLAWYLLYEKKYKPSQTEKEEQAKTLLTTARDAIQWLTIDQLQGDPKAGKYRTIQLKKSGTEWHLTAPVEDLADTGAINGLITTAASTKHERIVDEKPADLEPYGLKTPKVKVTVRTDKDKPGEVLLIGSDTPTGSSVYAKIDGKDTVYRVPLTVRSSFDKDPSEYRNKRVMNLSRSDITEAEIKTPSDAFVLKKTDGEQWTLVREAIPAADAEVNKTLNAVLEMLATSFPTEKGSAAMGKYGLAPAGVTFDFKKKDGTARVQLGKVGEKYYAKRGDKDVIFEINKDVYEKAARPSKDYRDLKLAQFNRFEVKRFKIEHGPESFELAKEASGWKLVSDATAEVETPKVEDYLSRLQDAKVASFNKGAAKPKAETTIHIFEMKNGKEVETVTLRFAKGGLAGERAGLDIPFSLTAEQFKKINAFKQEFLKEKK